MPCLCVNSALFLLDHVTYYKIHVMNSCITKDIKIKSVDKVLECSKVVC